MPQREFWTTAHPVEIRWRYWCDVTDVEAPSHLAVTVYDQSGSMMEHATIEVAPDITHELVGAALVESWEGYLFGERHDAPRALKLAARRFWQARVRGAVRRSATGN